MFLNLGNAGYLFIAITTRSTLPAFLEYDFHTFVQTELHRHFSQYLVDFLNRHHFLTLNSPRRIVGLFLKFYIHSQTQTMDIKLKKQTNLSSLGR